MKTQHANAYGMNAMKTVLRGIVIAVKADIKNIYILNQ